MVRTSNGIVHRFSMLGTNLKLLECTDLALEDYHMANACLNESKTLWCMLYVPNYHAWAKSPYFVLEIMRTEDFQLETANVTNTALYYEYFLLLFHKMVIDQNKDLDSVVDNGNISQEIKTLIKL